MSYYTGNASEFTHAMRREANAVARRNGCGVANVIVLGTQNRVIEHIAYGYRKHTTGEYVPHAYRAKFGWKNTYYQHATTVVEICA